MEKVLGEKLGQPCGNILHPPTVEVTNTFRLT